MLHDVHENQTFFLIPQKTDVVDLVCLHESGNVLRQVKDVQHKIKQYLFTFSVYCDKIFLFCPCKWLCAI